MTPEKVSALSDIELNRAMIWLYPPCQSIFITSLGDYAVHLRLVNYLTDYNFTMPLAINNNMNLDFIKDGYFTSCHAVSIDLDIGICDENPLRAICECLVLIALADK